MKDIWLVIEENKDIDIPNQKLMVANYRCQEIKQGFIEESQKSFRDLKMDMKLNPQLDLSMKYDSILRQSIRNYKEQT